MREPFEPIAYTGMTARLRWKAALWFRMVVHLEGPQIMMWVDGEVIAVPASHEHASLLSTMTNYCGTFGKESSLNAFIRALKKAEKEEAPTEGVCRGVAAEAVTGERARV